MQHVVHANVLPVLTHAIAMLLCHARSMSLCIDGQSQAHDTLDIKILLVWQYCLHRGCTFLMIAPTGTRCRIAQIYSYCR